jgi:hypothetical protein
MPRIQPLPQIRAIKMIPPIPKPIQRHGIRLVITQDPQGVEGPVLPVGVRECGLVFVVVRGVEVVAVDVVCFVEGWGRGGWRVT